MMPLVVSYSRSVACAHSWQRPDGSQDHLWFSSVDELYKQRHSVVLENSLRSRIFPGQDNQVVRSLK